MDEPIERPLNSRKLTELIGLLEEANRLGFRQTGISPVDILLETFIDLSLLMSDSFRLGGAYRRNSPSLRSSGEVDELNNERLIKIRKPSKLVRPDLVKTAFFKQLASLGVLIKNRPNDSLTVMFKELGIFLTSAGLTTDRHPKKQENVPSQKSIPGKMPSASARFAYNRRKEKRAKSDPDP